MTTSITDFFEKLKRESKQAPKHNDPDNVDEIELILSEYFTIHPNHIAMKAEYKKRFDQYPKTSRRCIEDLFFVGVYFYPFSKKYDKIVQITMVSTVLVDIDDLAVNNKGYITQREVTAVRTLTDDASLPLSIRELIRWLKEFLSGVSGVIRSKYIDLIADFVQGAGDETALDTERLSWTFEQYMSDRSSVILLRMYTYAIWIMEDRFTVDEFKRTEYLFAETDWWGILMNDHLSIWKELEDGDLGNWIILSCWQTGDPFKEVHTMQYRLTVNKTYELVGMLKNYDKRYNTDIGKNMLVFVAGIYFWNKYAQRYWISYLNN